MAVLPMKKISIYGLNQNRKDVLELLQRQSCVEISETKVKDGDVFKKTDISSSRITFENAQKTLKSAIDALDSLVKPETSSFAMFEGREKITKEQYKDTEQKALETLKIASKIVSLNKKISDEKAEIIRNNTSIQSLVPWKTLDISMRYKGTKNTDVFLGTLPFEYSESDLKNYLAKECPKVSAVDVEIISSNTQQTCIFTVCHTKYGSEIESALRNLGFSSPSSSSKGIPKEKIESLEEKIKQSNELLETTKNKIISYKDKRKEFLYTYDYYSARIEKYDALSKMAKSRNSFVIDGFIANEDSEKVKSSLESSFACHVEIKDFQKGEEAPVKLKNGGFAAPVEGVVESYSMPGKGEIDPSVIMGAFYYFLFGLMLSDLAYGLIMIIGCSFALVKFKNMETSLKNSIKMFLYCGISTAFWGLMFGSFFGDLIEVVGETFFNAQWVTPCLWFRPLNEPMTLLMFSLLLGIIHLFTGLGIKFYLLARMGKIKDAIYDVMFWYFLVGGGILYFMSMEMFKDISGLGFTLSPTIGNIGAALAIIGALGIIFTAGRSSKSPVIRFMKGLYGLYGATSYISDILSYSRLLALGLATGVIASVFNQMGAMAGGGFVGAIVFIIVFLMGHALNIGLNALGAYVHSNRLEFVEFFGKFYEGGGRKFKPFSTNTKYFKISEDN